MTTPTPGRPQPASDAGHVRLAVRIVGDAVDPADITARLRVIPTLAARKGEEIWSRGQSLRQRTGIWSFAVTEPAETGEEVDAALAALLARFPDDAALWEELAAHHECGVFCGLYLRPDSQGTALSPTTLEAVVRRRLTLNLDVFTAD